MNSSPLNPDAPVFVPGSVAGSDVLLAESPRKPLPMDDIELPDVAEFQTEAVIRPAELLDLDNCDQLNGHHNVSIDEATKEQLNGNEKCNMDSLGFGFDVDIESDKVKDTSLIQDLERIQKDTTDFCNIQIFPAHTETNPFAEDVNDEIFERLKNKERDPMSMSFYQEKDDDTSERLAKKELNVDLNAVQPLPDSDDDELQQNGVCDRTEENKENVYPDHSADILMGEDNITEPNNDILRLDDRTDVTSNSGFEQSDNFIDNMQSYSSTAFELNNPQETVAQSDTPESHKLLFEQIPEIPDGKSSELGFTCEDLQDPSEGDKETRVITPQDESQQDVEMDIKLEESPCIEIQSSTVLSSNEEPLDSIPTLESDHLIETKSYHEERATPVPTDENKTAETISPEPTHNVQENVIADIHEYADKEIDNDKHFEKELGNVITPGTQVDSALSAETTDDLIQVSEAPASSPLPSVSPLPSESPLPTQSPLPAVSPVPSQSPLPVELLVPSESILLPESPVPTDSVLQSQSPLPIESPIPTQSPLPIESPIPTRSPLPIESPIPTQSPLPPVSPVAPQSPLPAELMLHDRDSPLPAESVTSRSPLPTDSDIHLELSGISKSPVPIKSPNPMELELPVPAESSAPAEERQSSPLPTDVSLPRESPTPVAESPLPVESSLSIEPSIPRESPLPTESPQPFEVAPSDAPNFNTESVLSASPQPDDIAEVSPLPEEITEVKVECSLSPEIAQQDVHPDEITSGPTPDIVPEERTELSNPDTGVTESHAQEICMPVTSEILHEDEIQATATPPSTPAVDATHKPLAPASLDLPLVETPMAADIAAPEDNTATAAGVAAVAATAAVAAVATGAVSAKAKTPAKKSPTTPVAKSTSTTKSSTKPSTTTPRTPVSATKKPTSATPSAMRSTPARTPTSASKPATSVTKTTPSTRLSTAKLTAAKVPTTKPAPAKSSSAPVKEAPAATKNVPASRTTTAARPAAAPKTTTARPASAAAPRAAVSRAATAARPATTRPAARSAPAAKPKDATMTTSKPLEKKPLVNGDVKAPAKKPTSLKPTAPRAAATAAARPIPRATPAPAATTLPKSSGPRPAARGALSLDKLGKDLANKRITARTVPAKTTAGAKSGSAAKSVPKKVEHALGADAAVNGAIDDARGELPLKPPPSPPAADNAALPDVIA